MHPLTAFKASSQVDRLYNHLIQQEDVQTVWCLPSQAVEENCYGRGKKKGGEINLTQTASLSKMEAEGTDR